LQKNEYVRYKVREGSNVSSCHLPHSHSGKMVTSRCCVPAATFPPMTHIPHATFNFSWNNLKQESHCGKQCFQ